MQEPPLYFPMRRLSAEQFRSVALQAEASVPLLTTPLNDLPRIEVSYSLSKTLVSIFLPPSCCSAVLPVPSVCEVLTTPDLHSLDRAVSIGWI